MWLLFLIGIFALQVLAKERADDFEIEFLPGINVDDLEFSMHAGSITVEKSKKSNVFFWRIGSETPSNKTVIWLNGGPGCSSMDGLFLENGPLRMKKDQSIEINPGGWQRYATIVYVDQPVGTGFSTTENGYLHNMDELTDEFMVFLDKYSEIFPSIYDQEVYIAGESYAGTYIPYYAMPLLKRNKEESSKKYNLKGLMIGNGWISPAHQYPAYYDYAMKYNLVKGDFIKKLKKQMDKCGKAMEKEIQIHIDPCEEVFSVITEASIRELQDGKKVCINAYNKQLTNEPYDLCGADWPHEGAALQRYLHKPELLEAIHVHGKNISWEECDNSVFESLNRDESEPSYHLLPIILEDIPIMLYSGDEDIICNYIGTEYLIGNMTWNGERGLSSDANEIPWKIDGREPGYIIEERGLSYALIKGASHMVPYDKPTEMLSLFRQFIDMYDNNAQTKYELNDAKPSKKVKRDAQNVTLPEVIEERWGQYYYWGTGILVSMTVFTLSLCSCWYYERRRRIQNKFHDDPLLSEDIMMEERVFRKFKTAFRHKQDNGVYLDERSLSNNNDSLADHINLFEINDEDDSDAYSDYR